MYAVMESIKQMKCHQAVIIVTNNVEMRSLLRSISQNLKQHSFIDGTRDQMSVSLNYKYLSPVQSGSGPLTLQVTCRVESSPPVLIVDSSSCTATHSVSICIYMSQ